MGECMKAQERQESVREEETEGGGGEDTCAAVAFAKVAPPASGEGGEKAADGGHDGLNAGSPCLDGSVGETAVRRHGTRVGFIVGRGRNGVEDERERGVGGETIRRVGRGREEGGVVVDVVAVDGVAGELGKDLHSGSKRHAALKDKE